jgi:glycosyltransferase involved in cell wall biosynthesis
MKIFCAYRYFWPDTAPYGNILKSIAEKWTSDGHAVTVFSGHPSYSDTRQKRVPKRENLNNIKIIRVSLLPEINGVRWFRSVNFFIFFARIIIHNIINKKKYDLILVNSYPPVIMGLTAYLVKKILKKNYIYHCQDIHPESSFYAGFIKKNVFFNIIKMIDKKSCQKANLVVTLSEDMAETIKKRGIRNNHIIVLNNLILEVKEEDVLVPFSNLMDQNDFTVLFAGNIGNFQGLESIIEAAKLLRNNEKIKFIFMGDGSAKKKLIRQSGNSLEKTIFFIPFQPLNKAFFLMKKSNIALISLKPNIYKVAYPSKTMMYLAAGCPLIALVEEESELANFIHKKNIGYVCSQKNPKLIAETIKNAWENRKILENKRSRITEIAQDEFGKERILNEWSNIIKNIC